ncbi:MAG: UPF0280 family protein [Beijerinckiaceae bacterium]
MAVEGLAANRWSGPQAGWLSHNRLHLQHGPIDLIIKADGPVDAVQRAYEAATERFQTVLGELMGEIDNLRQPLRDEIRPQFQSVIAERMVVACWPHRTVYITPMAAVAGAVADEILATMLSASPALIKAYVNNGGDIAVHVSPGHALGIGVVADLVAAVPEGRITIQSGSGIGGLATSGWRGRSFSLGIADAVTVLAGSAAEADAAATIIANAVNTDDKAIVRTPARALDPDSDLGDIPVVTAVSAPSRAACEMALSNGVAQARALLEQNLIAGAYLSLQGLNITVMQETIQAAQKSLS